MPIYEGLSGPADDAREILNIADRAQNEAECLDGTRGIAGELAEIQNLARNLRAKLKADGEPDA